MQLKIITGPQGYGKTTELRELLKIHGNQAPAGIISATIYSAAELTSHVIQRIDAGDNYILIDDCSTAQISHLFRLLKRARSTGQAENLYIHAAKKA